MSKLFNRVKVSTSTTGTGTITLGSAVSGYQTFASAGVADTNIVSYVIEDTNGNVEIGTGTYAATGTTLSRSVIQSQISGVWGTSLITLSGTASVFITALQDDIMPIGGGSDQVFYENDQIVTANYTITTGKNAGTFGPITINSGATVTVPSGSTWIIR